MSTINKFTIKTEDLRFRYVATAEHYLWVDGVRATSQARDENTGQPLWKIRVMIVDPANSQAGSATVTVPATEPPVTGFEEPIEFDGLAVKFWLSKGTLGQSFTATAVKIGKPTASRKPAPAGAAN